MNNRWDSNTEDEDPQQWRKMTGEERMLLLEHPFILHPQLGRLMVDIDRCARHAVKASADTMHQPRSIAILGMAGVGKTALSRFWLEAAKSKAFEEGRGGAFPYLYVSVPPSATPRATTTMKGLLTALLNAVEASRFKEKRRPVSTWDMTRYLIELLQAAPIHLTFLDNCDRLIDRQIRRISDPLVGLLKDVTSQARVSMVLIGRAGETEPIFDTSPQLARRFESPRYLNPFVWDRDRPETVMECCSLLRTIDHMLPFDESGLWQEDMAYRLIYATGGFLGWIMKLIQSAATSAIYMSESTISQQRFAEAYTACIAATSQGLDKVNPFLPGNFSEM